MVREAKVTVGREWVDRTIYVTVSADENGIRSSMPLSDFLAALAVKIENPALIMTKAGLRERLAEAAEQLITEMKNQTTAVL